MMKYVTVDELCCEADVGGLGEAIPGLSLSEEVIIPFRRARTKALAALAGMTNAEAVRVRTLVSDRL